MKIWKLECSHCGDPLYAWGYFKNKPTVVDLTARFKEYDSEEGLIMINLALARKQGLEDINIYKINELQMARDDIHSAMQKFGNSANKHLLREIGKFLPEIELELQKLWGFEENLNYYKFWNVPFCNCPVIDNNDNYPHGYYTINTRCPVHGSD